MATSIGDSHADEDLRNLGKSHLENVSFFLSTLLRDNINISLSSSHKTRKCEMKKDQVNQNTRRLWTYAKCRMLQLQGGSKCIHETYRKLHQQQKNVTQKRGNKKTSITCRKCLNPSIMRLMKVRKFIHKVKGKRILRFSYKCDLCHSIQRRKVTLKKNQAASENIVKRPSSSSQLNPVASVFKKKLVHHSTSMDNLNKLLHQRRSGIDAKTGLLDFLLECNKK